MSRVIDVYQPRVLGDGPPQSGDGHGHEKSLRFADGDEQLVFLRDPYDPLSPGARQAAIRFDSGIYDL